MTGISKTEQSLGWAGLVTIGVCLLCLTAWSPPQAQSGPDLPPRHTPTRQPSNGDDKDEEPVGAHIELQASAAPPEAWTVVQWQDSMDRWHNVEGWQGNLDTVDRKVWWVAQRHFGSGPYRWLVYASRGGQLLGMSHSFYLPKAAYQTVSVAVSLDQPYRARPAPPAAPPPVAPLMPTTGGPPVTPWPSIVFLLALVLGGGLLSNYATRRW
jgi:hypothetical protein